MRKLPAIVCCFVLTYASLSGQNLSDSGFTDKTEAKNLIVNGLKEGKWIEFPHVDTIPPKRSYSEVNRKPWYRFIDYSYFRLTIYHLGIPIGIVREYVQYKILAGEKNYIDGKLNGIARYYWLNGIISCETPYKDDKMNGVERRYYTDGKIAKETPYTDGKYNGVMKSYYDNGVVMMEIPFTDNLKNGIQKEYYRSGKLKGETPYTDGKMGTPKNYDENGNEIKQ